MLNMPPGRRITIIIALLIVLGAVTYLYVVSSKTACRGIACFDKYAENTGSSGHYKLNNACAIVSPPTGVGIFKNKPLGWLVRDLLGLEYLFLSREFLFVFFKGQIDRPIIIINANYYIVEITKEELCLETMTISTSVQNGQSRIFVN